ncbi:hypothetical protein [Kangiella koreensis]|uniref:Uncharacterized protein n=1 Tax=Kangiella koreensis (strain DSM 16069 / JCM 12317 / KCTC 12182 / SW-125) TaxID=523791 RepID=C7R8Y3_KANKD|nr:hypothetical protein [Kangiella koreensis]ACV25996.1 hypothetical protein Kkor_0576 [Kangiella koreensis DSM 16069]
MSFKNRINLNPGEELEFVETFAAGSLGQKEKHRYDILDKDGNKVGRVQYNETTDLNSPHNTSYEVIKYDNSGEVILRERWCD